MTKLTKISAAALFALFLTACDKPATKTEAAPKAETTQTVAADAQGAEDFKKIQEWSKMQEANLVQVQADLQQSVASGDKAQAEAGLVAFQAKLDEILKSLEALDIKSDEVNNFKTKAKENLILSSELVAASISAMENLTPELQATIQEKAQKLQELSVDLQKTQAELQNKFAK